MFLSCLLICILTFTEVPSYKKNIKNQFFNSRVRASNDVGNLINLREQDNTDKQILDGDTGKELTKKCGQLEPSSSFFSNTNHLKIKVKNEGMYSVYDATFIASNNGIGCGGSLRNYGGIFTSPFYPLNTRNDSDCRWDIQVPNNMKVAIVFDVFDLGAKTTCRSDYIQIIETETTGEEVVRQYCGEDKPAPYRGRRNKLAIRYRKTVNFDGTGWVIKFAAINDDTKIYTIE